MKTPNQKLVDEAIDLSKSLATVNELPSNETTNQIKEAIQARLTKVLSHIRTRTDSPV